MRRIEQVFGCAKSELNLLPKGEQIQYQLYFSALNEKLRWITAFLVVI